MSDQKSIQLTCKCGKVYKTQRPYLNHIHNCQSKSKSDTQSTNITQSTDNNVTIQSVDNDTPTAVQPTQPTRTGRHLAPDPEYLAQIDNEMKHDLHQFMNSERPLPTYEPIEGENITVNTLVIETLLKTVLSQVLLHHHKHTQNIVEQNNKLIEENKMLVRMLRTVIYTKNNIKYEIDAQSSDSGDEKDDKDEKDEQNESDTNHA
jgi:hypothetical protein